MNTFTKDSQGNLITEASIIDHEFSGIIPDCPKCARDGTTIRFKRVGQDITFGGDIAGFRYQCMRCNTKLLVIND